MKISRLAALLLLACVVTSPATQDNLPPNFTGDNPATLLRQLADLRKRLIKSESETTPAQLNGKKVAYPVAVVYRFELF
jgi:hypothetical protein